MEIPEEFTTFWATTVTTEKENIINVPGDIECTISNAAVSLIKDGATSGRSVLYVKVNDMPETALVSFIINHYESTGLDIQFNPGDKLVFRLSGAKVSVSLSGYLTGGYTLAPEEKKAE